MNNKVAILGKLDTKNNAPFKDLTWDIWGINKQSTVIKLPRVDSWFDLHFEPTSYDNDYTRGNFPFEELDKMLGGHYFNNTVSYLIAYAIYKGYKKIALYGMRFDTRPEIKLRQYENVRELIFLLKVVV